MIVAFIDSERDSVSCFPIRKRRDEHEAFNQLAHAKRNASQRWRQDCTEYHAEHKPYNRVEDDMVQENCPQKNRF